MPLGDKQLHRQAQGRARRGLREARHPQEGGRSARGPSVNKESGGNKSESGRGKAHTASFVREWLRRGGPSAQGPRVTAGDLQDLLVKTLTRRSGGNARHWRAAVGSIVVHDVATHPHCNWSLRPSGSTAEVAAIERLLDTVRLAHPTVTAD